MPVFKEKSAKEEQQFDQNLNMLKTGLAFASVKPILNEEKKAAKEYEKFKPAIEKLVKIGEAARKFREQTQEMSGAIMPSQNEYAERAGKQMFVGTTTAFVAVAGTVIGAPVVNAWSLVKEGETTITTGDIKEIFQAAGKYLTTSQADAYSEFFNAAGNFDRSVKGFYSSFNRYTMELATGNVSKETAAGLSSALQEVAKTYSQVSMAFKNHGAELDEFSGFYTVSKEFAKDAAVTAITSVAIGYAIGKGAHMALHLAKGSARIAEEAATVAVGAARAEQAITAVAEVGSAAGKTQKVVVGMERVAEASHKLHEIREAGHLASECAEKRQTKYADVRFDD